MGDSSPLTSTSADSLVLIFDTDPLDRTDAEILTAIHELRRRRNAFTADEAAKALKPKSTRTKAEPSNPSSAAALDKPASEINLDDL